MNLELHFFAKNSPSSNAPILFIHGMAHAAWCWERNFVPFFQNQGYDCYTLSLRGHGGSDSPKNIRFYRIKEYLQDIKSAVSTIGQKPILIGHSMGGFLVQKYVLEGLELAAAITLSSIPHSGMLSGSLKIAKIYPWRFLKGNLLLSTAPFSDDKAVTKRLVFSDDISEEVLDYSFQNLEVESYLAYMDMLFLDTHKVAKTEVSMLFLHGENDFIVAKNEVQNTAALFGADFKSLPDIAHDMMLDTQWLMAATEIIHFLDKTNNATRQTS